MYMYLPLYGPARAHYSMWQPYAALSKEFGKYPCTYLCNIFLSAQGFDTVTTPTPFGSQVQASPATPFSRTPPLQYLTPTVSNGQLPVTPVKYAMFLLPPAGLLWLLSLTARVCLIRPNQLCTYTCMLFALMGFKGLSEFPISCKSVLHPY